MTLVIRKSRLAEHLQQDSPGERGNENLTCADASGRGGREDVRIV